MIVPRDETLFPKFYDYPQSSLREHLSDAHQQLAWRALPYVVQRVYCVSDIQLGFSDIQLIILVYELHYLLIYLLSLLPRDSAYQGSRKHEATGPLVCSSRFLVKGF